MLCIRFPRYMTCLTLKMVQTNRGPATQGPGALIYAWPYYVTRETRFDWTAPGSPHTAVGARTTLHTL